MWEMAKSENYDLSTLKLGGLITMETLVTKWQL